MPWLPIQSADVTNEVLPDEVTILNTVQGSSSILAAILASCVAEVQASVLVGGNQIGQPGTVPDQIRSDVIALVRWRWFSSLPKTDLQSDFRKAQYEEALKRIAGIRDGKEKVEIPLNPQNVAGPSNRTQVARPGPRMHDRGWSKLGET